MSSMKFLKRYKGTIKSAYFLTTGVILMMLLFFAPTFPKFESAGDNYFTVKLNGTEIGSCADLKVIDELIVQARREIAGDSGEMVYIPAKVEAEGKELLAGYVDRRKDLLKNIRAVMEDSVSETLKHAYTLKINQYTVNLGSSEDVLKLLQTVLDRYDAGREYEVGVVVDPDRQLNVLTTRVTRRGEEKKKRTAGEGAGAEAFFDELFEKIEPDMKAVDFESLDYGLVNLDFGDTVEIVDAYLLDNRITPLETAVSEVTADQAKEQIYEVQAGDTLSQIAEENGLAVEELVAINPMLENKDSMIRTGDELKITVPEPELSVVHQEQVYTEDSYEADVVYVDNDAWYTTESKVIQQPSAGFRRAASLVTYRNDTAENEDSYEADVVYVDNDAWYTTESKVIQQPSAGFRRAASLVTYRNDTAENMEIVKEEVVVEAQPKIVERGTKVPPTFVKPISGGRLTSSYGGRKAPTKGASTNHKGIDWATPIGTAVMASSGGTVTRAGWGSGYGYVVYIRHADGRETRYGHLSKVLVKAGQQVSQGQKIALSGNTGRSTGPHLHFELRINGASVNPLKYLD